MRTNKDLYPLAEVIKRAKSRGVNFGKSNPENRIRYYIKFGLLAHAKRKSFNGGPPGAAFGLEVIDQLVQIEKLRAKGKSVSDQKIILESKPKVKVKLQKKVYVQSKPEIAEKIYPLPKLALGMTIIVFVLFLGSLLLNLIPTERLSQRVLGAQTQNENFLVKTAKAILTPVAKADLALLKILKKTETIDPLNITNISKVIENNSDILESQIAKIKILSVERITSKSLKFPNFDEQNCLLRLDDNKNLVCDTNYSLKTNSETATNTSIDVRAFSKISVSSQSSLAADSISDTFTIIAGSGITLTSNSANDSLTINSSGGGIASGNADTLDNLDSLQFLRADTSSSFTSGTFTLGAGTTLSILGSFTCSSCVADSAVSDSITVGAAGSINASAINSGTLGNAGVTLALASFASITGSLVDSNISDSLTLDGTSSISAGAINSGTLGNAGVTLALASFGSITGSLGDGNVADNISLDWSGLQNYPAACSAGSAVTTIADSPTCSAFTRAGSAETITGGWTFNTNPTVFATNVVINDNNGIHNDVNLELGDGNEQASIIFYDQAGTSFTASLRSATTLTADRIFTLPDVASGNICISGVACDASTLSTLAAGSFLRSDTSDSFDSGTLTISDGTTLAVNSTTISIGNASSDTLTVDATGTFNTDVNLTLAGTENLNITNSTSTLAGAGTIDINVTNSTANARGIDNSFTTSTTSGFGDSAYGIYNDFIHNGGLDAWVAGAWVNNYYGLYQNYTKTGTDVCRSGFGSCTSNIINSYNIYSTASATGAVTESTGSVIRNTYAGYFTTTGDTNGTSSSAYGIYAGAVSADNNYGIYIAPTSGGTTNVGLCFDCDGTWTSSTVASGIQFGTDANSVSLYRSASDTLRTGDSLITDLDLTVSGGDVTFNNGTSNVVSWGTSGVAAPTDSSAGWKAQLYDLPGTAIYGFGINTNELWTSTDQDFTIYDVDTSTYTKRFEFDVDTAASPTLRFSDTATFTITDLAGTPNTMFSIADTGTVGNATITGTLTTQTTGSVLEGRNAIEGSGAACAAPATGSAGFWYADAGDCSTVFIGINSATNGSETFGFYSAAWNWVADRSGNVTQAGNLTIQGTTGLTFNTGAGGDITFANLEKIDNDTNGLITVTGDENVTGSLRVGTAAAAAGGWLAYVNGNTVGGSCAFGSCIGVLAIPIVITSSPTNAYGVYARADTANDTLTVTRASALFAANAIDGGANAHITTSIGLYLEPQTVGETDNYGICFDCDGTFGTQTVGTGIRWGTDGTSANNVQLYRSANGTGLFELGDGTDLMLASAADFQINLGAQVGGTAQRLCHNGADAATGVQSVGDCGATQADVAEYYGVTDNAAEADLVVSSGESYEVTTSAGKSSISNVERSFTTYQNTIIGVVSTNPSGEILGETVKSQLTNPKPIALIGRTPVKVSTENGPIAVGDPLTSSSIPGVTMKATETGPIVGKALANYDNSNPTTVSKLMVFVHVGWYAKPLADSQTPVDAGFANLTADSLTISNSIVVGDKITMDKNGKLTVDGEVIVAGKITLAGDITISGKLVFSELVVKKDSQSAGYGQIPANLTEVYIQSSKVGNDSLINLTAESEPDGVLFVKEKVENEGFIVAIKRFPGISTTARIDFNWLLVNQEN